MPILETLILSLNESNEKDLITVLPNLESVKHLIAEMLNCRSVDSLSGVIV